MKPILDVRGISKSFRIFDGLGRTKGVVQAVDDVSFSILPGETVGLVGESGCGKSTVGKLVVRLLEPDSGELLFEGTNIAHLGHRVLRPLRRRFQMVFQDPYGSLDPRQKAGSIVEEPLIVHRTGTSAERRERVAELFRQVGLRPDQMGNVPSQFSGGQRQRLAIARALALDPALIVADEAVSALDVSIQAQVINLMSRIRAERGLSYLFVAHDLGIVQHISDRVAVMYLGRLVEIAPKRTIFAEPVHPYTRMLLDSVPIPIPASQRGGRRRTVKGEIPSPLDPPAGCAFHPRCPLATDICRHERPLLRKHDNGSQAACHNAV